MDDNRSIQCAKFTRPEGIGGGAGSSTDPLCCMAAEKGVDKADNKVGKKQASENKSAHKKNQGKSEGQE